MNTSEIKAIFSMSFTSSEDKEADTIILSSSFCIIFFHMVNDRLGKQKYFFCVFPTSSVIHMLRVGKT